MIDFLLSYLYLLHIHVGTCTCLLYTYVHIALPSTFVLTCNSLFMMFHWKRTVERQYCYFIENKPNNTLFLWYMVHPPYHQVTCSNGIICWLCDGFLLTVNWLFPGGYLITQKDVFLDRARACQLIASMLSGRERTLKIDLPPPAIIKVFHKKSTHLVHIQTMRIWYIQV